MYHIRYKVNGETLPRRLARRQNYSLQRFLEERHDLRREALDHYRSVNTSRVTPQLEDVIELRLYNGHELISSHSFNPHPEA